MAEREYIVDKVYLQSPMGKILDYEPLVANLPGYKAVIPNKSAATKKAEKVDADRTAQLEQQQTEDAAAAKAAKAETAKAATAPKATTDNK